MKIRYIHCNDPNNAKIHDTQVVLQRNPFIQMSQDEFDKFTIAKLQADMNHGIILSYQVI